MKNLDLKQVLNNSLILIPSEPETTMLGFQISEKNITDSSHGIIAGMSDNIKNFEDGTKIEVGDDIYFRKNHAETILIEGEEYWFVPFQSCIYIK